MELRRSMEWVFGDVWCAKYPLTDVDTVCLICFKDFKSNLT